MVPQVTLATAPRKTWFTIISVGGERSFRRRLMEMGILPGTFVRVIGVAPLRDPITIETEHGRLSIRKREADTITVRK